MQSISAILPIDQSRAWSFQKLCAAGLSAMYVILYLMASLCLATGVFHPDTAHESAHHPHDHHHHDHGPVHESSPAAATPDVCDVVLQALMTPLWRLAPTMPVSALSSPMQVPADALYLPLYITTVNTIRAPPRRLCDVA